MAARSHDTDDTGLPEQEKKSLTDGLLALVETGKTSNRALIDVWLAKTINGFSGGAVIAPWEVEQLPEEWLDVFKAFTEDMPTMTKARAKVQAVKSAWLNRHPTYGK